MDFVIKKITGPFFQRPDLKLRLKVLPAGRAGFINRLKMVENFVIVQKTGPDLTHGLQMR